MSCQIKQLYHNEFGISFHWKHENGQNDPKIQLVFRDMGFYLNIEELKVFKNQVNQALSQSKACKCCMKSVRSKCILVKTPSNQVDLAMSFEEIKCLNKLISGTVFQYDLNNVLKKKGINS